MSTEEFRRVLVKVASYCAYQERCALEIREKLAELEVTEPGLVEEALAYLQAERFWDEARYAVSYAGGKFRHNQWGWLKIRHGLRQKQVSEALIAQARASITPEEYTQTLRALLEDKARQLRREPPAKKRQKLYQYALSKGFESEYIGEALRALGGPADEEILADE